MISMPFCRCMRCPVYCTMRSRAKRFAVSTMMVCTPLPAMRSSMAQKPGLRLEGISSLRSLIIVFADELIAATLGESLDGCPLALVAVLVGANAK
jgi:hypothetical protein